MRRRTLLQSAAAMTLAAPAIAQPKSLLRFVPHADLASLDPVWTTADITRNYSLAVFDTLFGIDAKFDIHPQMLAGFTTSADGLLWELTLRDGLLFHDGSKVTARDCVASITRFAARDAIGTALGARIAEITAPSDRLIRIRLKSRFGLLPNALAAYASAIMPEHLAKTDPMKAIPEAIGSGPFRFKADERIPGAKVVFEKFAGYVPRADGVPSFSAGPKIVHFDRMEWTVMPDAGTAMSALLNNEIDWWENPSIDLVPALRKDKRLTVEVHDVTGGIACLRFNHLLPPFDNPAIRRVVQKAINQRDVMTAVAGAEPSLIKVPVGLFVPGTQYASDAGLAANTNGWADIAALKKELIAAGYKGEKITVLGATTIPRIWAAAQVGADTLTRLGFNVDFQALEWGTVVQRRASKATTDKGGWNVFFTYLGGTGNISPATMSAARGDGEKAWFGWPTSPKMEALRDAWFDAPNLAAQQKLCAEMQEEMWNFVPYVPMGMHDQPIAHFSYLKDIRDGYPQFYGVRRG